MKRGVLRPDFDIREWSPVWYEGSGTVAVIRLYNLQLWQALTSENETPVNSTLCSVHANTPSVAASSQPALHMTAGFRDQREEVMRQAVAGPRLMKRSLPLSGTLREVLLYSLHALHLHFSCRFRVTRWQCRWGVAVSLKDSLTEVGGVAGLTLAPADDLSASGKTVCSCNITPSSHSDISKQTGANLYQSGFRL